ncbi:hypothetical protein KO465_00360 [Candidatus Micrarchaeota archaeon]|jgi:hypothetical protein|nr:hypothetical protein [Candidatus Micrarchaeota archaeon]
MLDEKNIISLKKDYVNIKSKVDEIGAESLDAIVEASLWLKNILNESESLKKMSEPQNIKDLGQKIKLHKRSKKLQKEIHIFKATISNEMKKQTIPSDIGNRLLETVRLIKNKKNEALSEFEYFESFISLQEKSKRYPDEIETLKSKIDWEINKTKKLIHEINNLNTITINNENVEKYKFYLASIEKLFKLRKKYISSLLQLNMAELINKIKTDSLNEYGLPILEWSNDENNFDTLYIFFKTDSFFSNIDIFKLSEMFDYTDERLAHIYPEVLNFKKIILTNQLWFERIKNLEETSFIKISDKTLSKELFDFYKKHVNGAEEIIIEFERNLNNISIWKKEYEKNVEYENDKKRLSNYSLPVLEKELQHYIHLKEIIDSENLDFIDVPSDVGIITKLRSFFKI